MALVMPQGNPSDRHHRRSYVAKFLTKDVNKMINLGVMKHHQSRPALRWRSRTCHTAW
jgi:hypothetical protein